MNRFASLILALALAACGGMATHYGRESFRPDPRFRRAYELPVDRVCKAVRHALLGQGYVVAQTGTEDEPAIVGQKEFRDKDKQHSVLQVHATCAPAPGGALVFATAVESRFDVASSDKSTSIGLPLVSPLSLTTSSSAESQVKLSGDTVMDKAFYDRLFIAVERELKAR